ncbi:MAG: hypothetical protein P9E88_05270 [Candidatus Competibacter sp.]|nr:hypothetical protein [Candidatus Competibacter sp.]
MSRQMAGAGRDYAPDFVSLETLAFRLDCQAGDVERLLRAGELPAPWRIGDLKRWDFAVVRAFIAGRNVGSGAGQRVRLAENGLPGRDDDPLLAAVAAAPVK